MKGNRTKSHVNYTPITNSGEVLLPGRHACNCESTKHALINNCLSCGRIVCEQERSGPCFTCGELVCSPKEQEQIARMSKAGYKLYNKLMNQKVETDSNDSSLQNALSHRDRLLEYDQTVEQRTKVIDDQSDYFQTDSSWLSVKERAILSKKKEEVKNIMHERKKNILTFDFAEKKVIEEKPVIDFNVDELLKSDISRFEYESSNDFNAPEGFMPVYENKQPTSFYNKSAENHENNKLKVVRIQDRVIQEMSDEGMCLSMHQPYASLLVAGIKKHEGRVWYTNHRGRLWIHAAGKLPTNKEIAEVEDDYKRILGNVKFPKSYPTGCLLGCVDVVDCLPQEEYQIQFPGGESGSSFVFICENARELSIKFPMKGKHKIFKLDQNIHQAAKKTLIKSD